VEEEEESYTWAPYEISEDDSYNKYHKYIFFYENVNKNMM
jgi:hypothetical protein